MPRKKKNIPNNFKGKEDLFFTKIRKGLLRFLAPASKHLKGIKWVKKKNG